MIFSVMIFSFIFTSRVNAKEIEQFCNSEFKCFTTEYIEELITLNNVNTLENNEYLLVAYISNSNKFYHLILFNSNNMKNGVNYLSTSSTIVFIGTDIININTTSLTTSSKFYTSTNPWVFGALASIQDNYVYYATTDIYDQNGDVYFAKNSDESLEPENTIRNFSSFYSSFLTILGNFCETIIKEPLLMFPFALCILIAIIFVFQSLI